MQGKNWPPKIQPYPTIIIPTLHFGWISSRPLWKMFPTQDHLCNASSIYYMSGGWLDSYLTNLKKLKDPLEIFLLYKGGPLWDLMGLGIYFICFLYHMDYYFMSEETLILQCAGPLISVCGVERKSLYKV